jgi:hypothetical protein
LIFLPECRKYVGMETTADRISKLAKRVGAAEEIIEIQADQIAGLLACCQMLAKRSGFSGQSDPMTVALVGPGMRPRVFDGTQIESLPQGIPGFYDLCIERMPAEEKADFERRKKIFSILRKDREEREKRRVSCVNKSPGGGAPGASHGPSL